MTPCKHSTPTGVPWFPGTNTKCRVYLCRYRGPKQVAQGHARKPTVGLRPTGPLDPEADYLCVRSKYCSPACVPYEPAESVSHFVGLPQINARKT